MKKSRLRRWLDIQADENDGLRVADGFDAALVGITAYQPGRPVLVVYDYEKCIAVLVKQARKAKVNKGKSVAELDEEAREHMEFNVVGAWVGDDTPVFLVKP